MKYYTEIGEIIIIDEVTGRCVEGDNCGDCVLHNNCKHLMCNASMRSDKKSVHFEDIYKEMSRKKHAATTGCEFCNHVSTAKINTMNQF